MVYVSGALSKDKIAKFRDNFRNAQEQNKFKRTAVALELNYGCSNHCSFCQMNSEKGAKRPIPPDLVYVIGEERVNDPQTSTPRIMLQFASEPGDYSFAGWDATDIARHLSSALQKRGLEPLISITTAVPVGSEDWFFRLIKEDNEGMDVRLSFSFINESRLISRPEFQELCRRFSIVKQNAVARFRISEKTGILPPGVTSMENAMIKIFGTDKTAEIEIIGETRENSLVSVDNQLAFSKKVLTGDIKEGQNFRMLFWEPYTVVCLNNTWIQMRNWDIQPKGRAYSEESNKDNEGSKTNLLLIRSDGSIHHVKGAKPTADNPEGQNITQLYEPIY